MTGTRTIEAGLVRSHRPPAAVGLARGSEVRAPPGTGRSGVVRTPTASRSPPILRSSGARRRTSAGRSRFPAAAPRRPSSGAIGSSCPPPFRSASPAMRSTRREAACSRAACIASSSWPSIARPGSTVWERVAAEQEPHEAAHFDNSTWASSSPITDGETRLRLLRVVRSVRLRHERQAALAEGSRRQADAEPVRRGIDAGAPRQHARHRLGSPERHSRSSSRSTSATARNCGACRARKSTPGPRRSSSR